MPAPSRSRKRSTASANAGCASQCALVRLHRHQRARHLVLALRAAFEALHAVLDAPLQRLVVAGLEVQAVHPLQRAPVAAVGHRRARRRHRSRARSGWSRSACPPRSAMNSSQCSGIVVGHAAEEVARSGRAGCRARGRCARSSGRRSPSRPRAMSAPRGQRKRDAGIGHLAALLPDLLALVLRQAGEEGVEVGQSCVEPVELHGVAQHQAGLRAGRDVLVGARTAGAATTASPACTRPAAPRTSARARRGVARQQARARHRRERHRHQRLGVVGQAVLLVGVGPGPVEHVLAVRVVLEVQRAGAPAARSPRHSVTKRGVQPVLGVALPLSCRAARYSWRMNGVGASCAASSVVPRACVDLGRCGAEADDIIVRVVSYCTCCPMALTSASPSSTSWWATCRAMRRRSSTRRARPTSRARAWCSRPSCRSAAMRPRTCSCARPSSLPAMMP